MGKNKTIDKSKPVLVTGATGYVAGWLIKKLLDEGLTVHAAIRDPGQKEKIRHLEELAETSKGSIRFFAADLLDIGSYARAMEGCELVFHTASPFIAAVDDPQRELIEPALLGTRHVLEQANHTPTVQRVVLTSSVAALYGDNKDIEKVPNKIYTEDVWNTSSSVHHQAYSYSKTLAEKEAWEISRKQSQWDLVVINPSLVLGPALNSSAVTSESFRIFRQFGDGTLKMGVPRIGFGVVDVRDLALAHFQAGFTPEAKGRHIVSGHNTWLHEMAEALLPEFGDRFPLPKRLLPKSIVWLAGPFINKAMTRKYVSRNVGYPFVADNTKSIRSLGISYRPLEETLSDTFRQFIASGLFQS